MIARLLAALCLIAPFGLRAEPFELTFGYDHFVQQDTTLHGFHKLGLRHRIGPDLWFGETIYSAAAGDAGGLFVGGVTLTKGIALGPRTRAELSAFAGGGGGANQVPGDGLMLLAGAEIAHQISPRLALMAGAGYTRITGSDIATPTLTFGLQKSIDLNVSRRSGARVQSGTSMAAIKPIVQAFVPMGSQVRAGTRDLTTMYLFGAEIAFAGAGDATGQGGAQTFISAAGAAAGDGEGYAEWRIGRRITRPVGRARAFAEASLGFAGGGDVDTGGGLIVAAGVGGSVPLSRALSLEIGANAMTAPDGDFTALAPYARLAFDFAGTAGREPAKPRRLWQVSTGLSAQLHNEGFRKTETTKAALGLVETSLDLFLTDRFYFTGNAQTVMAGDAGGYAVGLIGAGYELPLGGRWSAAGELHLGAAAGGGIETRGGLVGGGRIELDYALASGVKISGGVGYLSILRGGSGARPVTLHLGLKMPFDSHH